MLWRSKVLSPFHISDISKRSSEHPFASQNDFKAAVPCLGALLCISQVALSNLGVGKEGQSLKGKSKLTTWGLFSAIAQVDFYQWPFKSRSSTPFTKTNKLISLETTTFQEISEHEAERHRNAICAQPGWIFPALPEQ